MFYPELKGPALDAYRQMVKKLKATASKELGVSEDELVTRSLRPADIGQNASTPDHYVGLTALTWTNIINAQTIADNRFVGICGVSVGSGSTAIPTLGAGADVRNLSSAVDQIRITRKGSVARYWQVKPLVHWAHGTGWVDDPVTVDQNTTITVEGLSRLASSIAGFDLLGVVVEKRGLLINP